MENSTGVQVVINGDRQNTTRCTDDDAIKTEVFIGRDGGKEEHVVGTPKKDKKERKNGADAVHHCVDGYYEGKRLSKYEIISIREKHGMFRKAVPCMPIPVAILLCLMNVGIPGSGTLLSSLTILCGCRTEHLKKSTAVLYNVIGAMLQLVMAPIIVGWIWSIYWGFTFVHLSVTKALQEPEPKTDI